MKKMRRLNREVTDKKEILQILDTCDVCRIGFWDEEIYIVPLNFAYSFDDKLILYFHGASDGRKANILKNSPVNVGFELDCCHKMIEGKNSCNSSFNYKSIIGNGKATTVGDTFEKEHILNLILKKYINKDNNNFPQKAIDNTLVFKIIVNKFSAKQNI